MEDLGTIPDDPEYEAVEEAEVMSMDSSAHEAGGLYIPDFLGEAPDGNWGLTVRMAKVIC